MAHKTKSSGMKAPKMRKDFKTGMALGLVLVTVVMVWLSTRPSLSVKARVLGPGSAAHREIGTPPNNAGLRKEAAIDKNPTGQAKSLMVADKPPPADELKLPEFSANEQSKEIKTERFHIVRSGETLSDISYKHYGSADKWQKILDANRSRLKDANTLIPGMRLTIPQ
jgi:nucleoid-associated protein YgaU